MNAVKHSTALDFGHEYLTTFFAEKVLPVVSWDLVAEDGTPHDVDNIVVLEHLAIAPRGEQDACADIIRKLDFANGDINHFLKHLAGALINR